MMCRRATPIAVAALAAAPYAAEARARRMTQQRRTGRPSREPIRLPFARPALGRPQGFSLQEALPARDVLRARNQVQMLAGFKPAPLHFLAAPMRGCDAHPRGSQNASSLGH
jgi:hypothetical protein